MGAFSLIVVINLLNRFDMYKVKAVKDISDHPSFYQDALSYWEKVEPSVNGMLGGLEELTNIDLTSSMQFVYSYVQQ